MSIESPLQSEESAQQGYGRWRRFRQWLGAIGSRSTDREASGSVSYQDRDYATQLRINDESDDACDVNAIVDASVERHREVTKNEAGRSEGRIVPALVLGAQRYPDPSIWGPNIDTPLTEDETYGEVTELIDKLDTPNGFDGREF